MAATNALISLAEAKLHLGVAADVTTYDDKITDLIDSASNQIERFCKTYFIQRTITAEPHDGARKIIFLNNYPVVSVTTIVDTGGNTIPASDYYLEKTTGRMTHWGRFPRPTATSGLTTKWLVTYVAGWWTKLEEVDGDLKTACKRLVSLDYENPTGGVTSISVGSLSVSYATATVDGVSGGMPPSVAGLLSTYRRNVTP